MKLNNESRQSIKKFFDDDSPGTLFALMGSRKYSVHRDRFLKKITILIFDNWTVRTLPFLSPELNAENVIESIEDYEDMIEEVIKRRDDPVGFPV